VQRPEDSLPLSPSVSHQVSAATGIPFEDLTVQKLLLHSESRCTEQFCHNDFGQDAQDGHGKMGFSLVVALDDHTYLVIFDQDGNRWYLHIPKGYGCIFSHRCRHAGAAYVVAGTPPLPGQRAVGDGDPLPGGLSGRAPGAEPPAGAQHGYQGPRSGAGGSVSL
jgi:hypothetical protein